MPARNYMAWNAIPGNQRELKESAYFITTILSLSSKTKLLISLSKVSITMTCPYLQKLNSYRRDTSRMAAICVDPLFAMALGPLPGNRVCFLAYGFSHSVIIPFLGIKRSDINSF